VHPTSSITKYKKKGQISIKGCDWMVNPASPKIPSPSKSSPKVPARLLPARRPFIQASRFIAILASLNPTTWMDEVLSCQKFYQHYHGGATSWLFGLFVLSQSSKVLPKFLPGSESQANQMLQIEACFTERTFTPESYIHKVYCPKVLERPSEVSTRSPGRYFCYVDKNDLVRAEGTMSPFN